METDWGMALSVIAKGFTAVFLVLSILAICVSISSRIIMALEKNGQKQVKADS